MQPFGPGFRHGITSVGEAVVTGKSKVNILKDDRQHRHVETPMPYQNDIPIRVSAIRHQSLDERDKAVLDVMETLSAGHPAVKLLMAKPEFLYLAVQLPAHRVGCAFVDAHAPFS